MLGKFLEGDSPHKPVDKKSSPATELGPLTVYAPAKN
jgi:hypothetical protein